MPGSFENHSITISFEVFGVSEDLKSPLKGVVDTGFNGHLILPFAVAFPLGLILKGEQESTLADGRVVNSFVCLGTIIFQGTSVVVPIDIMPSGPILVGMQLLEKLGFELSINFRDQKYDFLPARPKKIGLPKVKINLK